MLGNPRHRDDHGLSALKMWRTVWCVVYDTIKSKECQSSTTKVSKSSTLLLAQVLSREQLCDLVESSKKQILQDMSP